MSSTPKNYLPRLLIDENAAEYLTWNSLTAEEVLVASNTSKWDIDFLSVTGEAVQLFLNEKFLGMIQSSSCFIYKAPKQETCRAASFKQVLRFATVGDFGVGIPLRTNNNDEDTMTNDVNDSREATKVSKRKREVIKLELKKNTEYGSMITRDWLTIISTFSLDKIVLYKYGQKESFTLNSLLYNNFLLSGFKVDVALAVEIAFPLKYVSASVRN